MHEHPLSHRILEALEGLDLRSADGRAGIQSLLAEIERLAPGSVERMAGHVERKKVGLSKTLPS